MHKILKAAILVGTLGISGCKEELQSARISINEGPSKNSFFIQFNPTAKSASLEVKITNNQGRPCRRLETMSSEDATSIRSLVQKLQICSYEQDCKLAPPVDEAFVEAQYKSSSWGSRKVIADIQQMECSARKHFLCGAGADEVPLLVILLTLAYANPKDPAFKCD